MGDVGTTVSLLLETNCRSDGKLTFRNIIILTQETIIRNEEASSALTKNINLIRRFTFHTGGVVRIRTRVHKIGEPAGNIRYLFTKNGLAAGKGRRLFLRAACSAWIAQDFQKITRSSSCSSGQGYGFLNVERGSRPQAKIYYESRLTHDSGRHASISSISSCVFLQRCFLKPCILCSWSRRSLCPPSPHRSPYWYGFWILRQIL